MKKKKEMYTLEELYVYRSKTEDKKSFSAWYYHHNKYIWLIGVLILAVAGLIAMILLITLCFNIPFVLNITASLVISIVAFVISITTLLINIIRIMDYPIDNLSINKLKSEDNVYELQFSVKNCGHGKLKLDFAMYFIQALDANGPKIEKKQINEKFKDTEVKNILYYTHKAFSLYLKEIIAKKDSGEIRPYYLKEITKFAGLYFTHDDEHVESRVHKFEENKIYAITFLFRTTHRIFWYKTKHIQT